MIATNCLKVQIETRMQKSLDRLGIPLTIIWQPDETKKVHGEIDKSSKTLFLYNVSMEEAWDTLLHEALEWKLKEVLTPYRETINGFIDIIEKICYKEKEKFLEVIPTIIKVIQEEGKNEA